MKLFLSLILILCPLVCDTYRRLPTGKQIRVALDLKKQFSGRQSKAVEKVVIRSDYKVAAGFLATSAAIIFAAHNPVLGIPVGLIGAFLAFQTGRVRFVFDDVAMEVCYADKIGDTEKLVESRENFAVGGKNRWRYDTFTNWFFIPSRQLPILMYFKETQTRPEGQLHLFPVIMNGGQLFEQLTAKVGPKSPLGIAVPKLSVGTSATASASPTQLHQSTATASVSSTSSSSVPFTIPTHESVTQDYAANIMNTYGRYPLTISHGKGVKLYDIEGKEYLDFAAGIATCVIGHAHPALKEAISAQLDRVNHCSNLYYIPEQAALAKWLVKHSCADKAFFCNSGAEANEAAIKLARKYAHTRLGIDFPVIVTAVNSFHGRTLTAITATGQAKYQKDFGPLTPGFEYTPYNDAAALRSLVASIQQSGGGRGLAAVLMEPLQGEGGVTPGDTTFFQEVRRICDDTGALMICDEVQTGMGRTGKMWGYENLGIEPDAFTSAKAIGGGVPLGAMLCKEKFNVFGPGDHASTYGGNPLACAAGLAVAKCFDEQDLVGNAGARGEQLRSLARQTMKKWPEVVGEVRGWGLMCGVQLSEGTALTAAEVTKELSAMGMLVVPAGPKVVRFVPPLIITEDEVAEGMKKFDAAITKLAIATGDVVSP